MTKNGDDSFITIEQGLFQLLPEDFESVRRHSEECCRTWCLQHKYETILHKLQSNQHIWLILISYNEKEDKRNEKLIVKIANLIEVLLSYTKMLLQLADYEKAESVLALIAKLIPRLPLKWSYKHNLEKCFAQRAMWTYHTLHWVMLGRVNKKVPAIISLLKAYKLEKKEYLRFAKHGIPSCSETLGEDTKLPDKIDRRETQTDDQRELYDRHFWLSILSSLNSMNPIWEEQIASFNKLRICFMCQCKLDMETKVTCRRCKTVSYCSEKCRIQDLKRHEGECHDGFCSWDDFSANKAIDVRRPILLEQLRRVTCWNGLNTLTNLELNEEEDSIHTFKHEQLFWELYNDMKCSKVPYYEMITSFGYKPLHSPLEGKYSFVIYTLLLFMRLQLQKGNLHITKRIHTLLAYIVQHTNIAQEMDYHSIYEEFSLCYYKIKQWEWIMYTLMDKKTNTLESFSATRQVEETLEQLGKIKPELNHSETRSIFEMFDKNNQLRPPFNVTCKTVDTFHRASLMTINGRMDASDKTLWDQIGRMIKLLKMTWSAISHYDYPHLSIKSKDQFALICSGCGKIEKSRDFQLCAACRSCYYCSEKCQQDDWERHAKECAFVTGEKPTKID